MSHPCDGHACDHCYLCDVVGVCCATVPGAAAASVACAHGPALHAAVVQEAELLASLAQLIRRDVAAELLPAASPLALPAGGPPARGVLSLNSTRDQEAEHVFATRRHR